MVKLFVGVYLTVMEGVSSFGDLQQDLSIFLVLVTETGERTTIYRCYNISDNRIVDNLQNVKYKCL